MLRQPFRALAGLSRGRSARVSPAPLRPAAFQPFTSTPSRRFQTAGSSSSSKSWWTRSSSLKTLLLGASGLTLYTIIQKERLDQAEACGIVGYLGADPAVDHLLEGLHILQNRGYDSAGIATINSEGDLVTSKFASVGSTSDSIAILKTEAPGAHNKDTVGIAHTRWATHGGRTDENAHPHSDYKNRIALVHNGTIENYAELKAELEAEGMTFKSNTDTEVIANLIGHYLDLDLDLLTSVQSAFTRLEGTWGVAIIHKDMPDQIIAARNGSPLVLGLDEGRTFVASELSAFSRHTRQYIALKDGEMAVVTRDGVVSLDKNRVEEAPEEHILLDPSPYPHWTQKEIMEQPQAIARTLGYGSRFYQDGRVKLGGLDNNRDRLLGIKDLVMAGCGTSYYALLYGAQLMRSLRVFDTVQTWDASEVNSDTFPERDSGLVVVSQSGETKDTHRALAIADRASAPTFSIVNQVGSLIARHTNCGVYLNAGREHAVASTKAFTTQVTALALCAAWFAQQRAIDQEQSLNLNTKCTELVEAIYRLPTCCGIALKSYDICKRIAGHMDNQNDVFILGKGFAEPIAREGALKIKELSYVHAEGYCGGALKHGPFALLQKGTPVILMILDDPHQDLMRIAAQEVRARGAYTIVITDKAKLADGCADDVVIVPSNGPLTALLAVVPLQIIAYEMSLRRGIDPDKPRNLAKAVTVD